jgi:hypothetical protein
VNEEKKELRLYKNLKGNTEAFKAVYSAKTGRDIPNGKTQQTVRSPFKEDKNPSMSVNLIGPKFSCKATGIHGNIFNLFLERNNLSKSEVMEATIPIYQLIGDSHLANQYMMEEKKEEPKPPTYNESETWNFIYAWHEMKQSMIDNFKGNKKILATLYSYFGQDYKLEYEFIQDMAMNYNIGWCPIYECITIPYFSEEKVTYIDLMKWGGDDFKEKKIYAYPSPKHIQEHKHLNVKNDGFENAMELKKLSKCRLASNFKNTGRKDSLKRKPDEPLFVCEGFKDSLIATYFDLNAISTAGGAQSLGTFENESIIELLKKRSSIGICFDNDEPGKAGATELKTLLESKGVTNVNIVDLSDVCTLKGEDLTDYFLKYQGDAKTLVKRAMGANV